MVSRTLHLLYPTHGISPVVGKGWGREAGKIQKILTSGHYSLIVKLLVWGGDPLSQSQGSSSLVMYRQINMQHKVTVFSG